MRDPDIQLVDLPCDRNKVIAPAATIGMGQGLSARDLLREAVTSGIQQIVQKANPDLQSDLETARMMIQDPAKFLDFPLSSIFQPLQAGPDTEKLVTSFHFDFDRASQKSNMLDELDEHLKTFLNSSSRYDLCLIADELFSNACYNAPYNSGTAKTNEISRLDPAIRETLLRPGSIMVGSNADKTVIACRDLYGTLNPDALLRRLLHCFEDGASNSMELGNGGAGLGSMMIYSACSGYYVGVNSGVRTVIAAKISQGSQKNRGENNKTLHFFTR